MSTKNTVTGSFSNVIQYETPNAETIEAIEEVQRMKADPSIGKTYSSVDEMMKELLDVLKS